MNTLKEEIHAYWRQRAEGYSEYNQQEMADARRSMWKNKLLSLLEENFPGKNPEELKVLDVGTGPGFFALLLAEAGYQVTAADVTEEMLKEAKKNTGVFAPGSSVTPRSLNWETANLTRYFPEMLPGIWKTRDRRMRNGYVC